MKAIEKMYGRWGNYIPVDTRKQFEKDCLEAEQQIKELGMQIITKDGENQLLMEQIKELKEYVRHGSYCPTYAGFSIDACNCGLDELLNKH